MSAIVLKIILAGDGGVGKTTLLRRYLEGQYRHSVLTVGAQFGSKDVLIGGEDFQVVFWDFGGEPRFRMLFPQFCAGSHCAVLMFDLSRFTTFANLDEWLPLLKNTVPSIPVILVGAKSDLRRSVDDDLAFRYVETNGLTGYFEVSAKEDIGVQEAFDFIITHTVRTHIH